MPEEGALHERACGGQGVGPCGSVPTMPGSALGARAIPVGDASRPFIGRLESPSLGVRMRKCWMAAEKRAALVVSRWLKEAVGRDRTLTNDPQEEEELRGRAERFFSHLFVDFPSLTRLMLLRAGDAAPLKCLICSRRRFGSLRELRKHAHRGTRRERRAEHLGYYDALVRARLPRYYNAESSSSEEEG